MDCSDGYVGDRAGGGFLSKFRIVLLLLLALSIVAPAAMAIDEVIIKHKGGDTWSSHAEGASPWQFCHDADGSGEPFKAVAAGFIDTDGDPSNDPDKPINWKVVITNTETGDPTVLIDCSDPNDKGYHAGDEIEFDMPLHTAGPYKLKATATNAENDGDSASDTDEVDVVEVTFDSLESPICAATADHEAGTSLAEASVTPSDRELKWELMDNDIGVSWKTSDGNTTQGTVITESNTIVAVAGSEGGTVTARVCDSVLTPCTAATKQLDVAKVKITQPTGDPGNPKEATKWNEVVFNTDIPGVLNVRCKAADSGLDNDNLTWHATTLGGEEWTPPAGSGYEGGITRSASFTYTGLSPVIFGEQEISLVYYWAGPGCGPVCSDTTTIEVFYAPYAENHAGPKQGETDNFFHYYQQSPAGFEDAVFDENVRADGKEVPAVAYLYRESNGYISDAPEKIYVGWKAFSGGSGARGPYLTGDNVRSGIDSYRIILAHEKQHFQDYTRGEGEYDHDNDGIAWWLEDSNTNGKWEWWRGETAPGNTTSECADERTSYTKIVTKVDGKNPGTVQAKVDDDGEWRASQAELDVELEKHDEYDWAKGGSNWDH